ncbi:DoxX family protein [Gordonia sp. CPCC 206044]|uniref:DoxX family protein n=1 Tax=Gordonia sp. CPCC 206044 TaxID=3140793 RepID=UPI003AF39207
MSERDMAAPGGSSPYDEPTGEIGITDEAASRRRAVPTSERDDFYARHAMPENAAVSRVDELDDIDPDDLQTRPIAKSPPADAPTRAFSRTEPAARDEPEPEPVPTQRLDDTSLPPVADRPYPEAATTAFGAATLDTEPLAEPDHRIDDPVVDDEPRTAEQDLVDAQKRARRGTLDLGLLLLRVAVGVIALAHGTQKLFGWWNGPGLSGFEDFLINSPNPGLGFDSGAARVLAIVGALSETLGGLMLVVGLFTPIAAAAVLGVMLVAGAFKATLAGGIWFFAADGNGAGLEYEGLLVVCAAVIILTGPGRISLDAPRGWARRPAWGSLALFVVAIAAAVAVWVVFNGTNPLQSPGNPTQG